MKIVVRTPITQWSGYGRDGIGLVHALLDRKHDVRISPTHVDIPLPRDIAGLLTYPHEELYDLAIHHQEPEKIFLTKSDSLMARKNVAWTMWGWEKLPNEPFVETLPDRFELFDHIALYEQASINAFAEKIGHDRLIKVMGGYESADWNMPEQPLDIPGKPYTFAMLGRLTPRKGTYITYEAFNILKEKYGDEFNAQLILRTTEPIFPPDMPLPTGVYHNVAKSLPEQLKVFYWGVDTLVCPSMADAKNLPPIEALACGTPVILSRTSGHTDWGMSSFVSWVEAEPLTIEPGYTGPGVKPEALAEVMWDHYTNQPKHRLKGALGSRTLPSMMDWSKCVERLGMQIGLPL